jgi:hypothetical protein
MKYNLILYIISQIHKKPAHNSAQAQPEKGMRLCAER